MLASIALFNLLLFAGLRSSQASREVGRNGEITHLAKFCGKTHEGSSTRCRRNGPHFCESRRTTDGVAASITLFTEEAAFTVDPQFLSVTLGIGKMRNDWAAVNFSAPRVVNTAKALSPAMLRLGGTRADFLTFKPTQAENHNFTNETFSPGQWDGVNHFARMVGWEFIFGLNSLLRYPDGVWDSNNAALLMSYSNSKNYNVQWELGNEPNAWDRFGYNITPSEHAHDFYTLKYLVERVKPVGKMIVGPDVGGNNVNYLQSFLQGLSVYGKTLSAITYHHYYAAGSTATESLFYNVSVLDSFINLTIQFKSVSEECMPGVDLWIGESGSTFGGGTPGLSDSFIAGFMWLDKLGIAALTGHKRVFREEFVSSSYGLLDRDEIPLPDYWLSALYKKLVGTKVIYVRGSLEYGRHLRVYAHCAKSLYPAGSVVLLLLNLNFSAVSADLLNSELVSSERDVFWLSPPAGNLTSTSVQLNGLTLKLVDDRDLPELEPEEQPASPSLSLPAISFGFIVFKDANVKACL